MSQWFKTFHLVCAYVSYCFIVIPDHSARSCFENLPILLFCVSVNQCTIARFIFEYLVPENV